MPNVVLTHEPSATSAGLSGGFDEWSETRINPILGRSLNSPGCLFHT
jgi:hypothetical protein